MRLQPLHAPRGPDYPPGARTRGEGARVAVAFVLDSAGRVELPTIAFVRSAPEEFERAVCVFLQHATFTPLRANGRPRRALVVQPFDFDPGTGGSVPAVDDHSIADRLDQMGVPGVFQYLEQLPHCR